MDLWKTNSTYDGPALDERAIMLASGNKTNVEDLFSEFASAYLKSFDVKKGPLFMYHAFHLVHEPLEPPCDWLDSFLECHAMFEERRKYGAMVAFMDHKFGVLVKGLKDAGLWDNTLLLFTSDNGGPIYHDGGANNFPMLGGKEADWEGGIRVASFVGGGYLPNAQRGRVSDQLLSFADWYPTFASLANAKNLGVNDAPAVALGLPNIDGVDAWPAISKDESVRNEIYLGTQAYMHGEWKFVQGNQTNHLWPPRIYPDTSVSGRPIHVTPVSVEYVEGKYVDSTGYLDMANAKLNGPTLMSCGELGCLFNVAIDPTERVNLVLNFPDIATMMRKKLADYNLSHFSPGRGLQCNTNTNSCCERLWVDYRRGYGPFVNGTRLLGSS